MLEYCNKMHLKEKAMEKEIIYCGQEAKVACDEKCSKAWGINNRPKLQLSDDENDTCYLSDDELGEAHADLGTYEGGYAKPTCVEAMMNKWCVRECEQSSMSALGGHNKELALRDFSKRVYNLAWRRNKGQS